MCSGEHRHRLQVFQVKTVLHPSDAVAGGVATAAHPAERSGGIASSHACTQRSVHVALRPVLSADKGHYKRADLRQGEGESGVQCA